MIKVNLLDSVTDRAKGVAAVEERVASPRAQTILMGIVVMALLAVGVGYDYVSAKADHSAAEVALAKEKAITPDAGRAIQNLRASQRGPSEVLLEVKERVDTIPGLYLESLEQKGGGLVLKGGSPNESSVARLGQSLEFSSGRFSDLSIETERKPVEPIVPKGATAATLDLKDKPEIVNFTIKCNYAPRPAQPAASPGANAAQPANQIAQK